MSQVWTVQERAGMTASTSGWVKSSLSSWDMPKCVELYRNGDYIKFRNSREPDGAMLMFHRAAVHSLFDQIKAGGRAGFDGLIALQWDGVKYLMYSTRGGEDCLTFTEAEVEAFIGGVCGGEFDYLMDGDAVFDAEPSVLAIT